MFSLNLLSVILSFLIIVAESICCYIFFKTFLVRRVAIFTNKIHVCIEFLCLLLFNFLISNLVSGYTKLILVATAYFVIIHFFNEGSILKKVFLSCLICLLILLVDIVSLQIIRLFTSLPLNYVKNVPLYFFLAAIFSKTLLFNTIIIAKNIITVKSSSNLKYFSGYSWFIYILQGITSMISLLSLIELTYIIGSVPAIAIIATISLFYLNSAVFGILEKSMRLEMNNHENGLYRQQAESDMNNLGVLISSFNTQNGVLHDYKQHLSTIYQLIKDEKYISAQNLIKTIADDMYVALYRFKTNHEIIDAILNQKYIQANNQNVILDVRASDLFNVNIEDCYLITIISNAIDNAIEACSKTSSQKIVSIKLVIENNILIFSVINPVEGQVEILNNTIKTTKADKTIHGVGLKNISLALQKCNGDYELGCNNNFFQFTAFIRLENVS